MLFLKANFERQPAWLESFVLSATHSKSGMPLTQGFWLFVAGKRPLLLAEYWEEGHRWRLAGRWPIIVQD